jgi:uncharacterized protein (TIGR00369 family)
LFPGVRLPRKLLESVSVLLMRAAIPSRRPDGASILSESLRRGPVTELNRLIKDNRVAEYSSPNLALGMRPVAFGAGISQWVWERQPAAALNPFGVVQGGYAAILIDEMLSTAIASVLEDGEWAMTAELKINFLRALSPGNLRGDARVLKRSRSIAFLEARITDRTDAIAATASSTWAILRS